MAVSKSFANINLEMTLIPPSFLDCVVALGTRMANGEGNWFATGFLFGRWSKKIDDDHSVYGTYLVTNRHVMKGLLTCENGTWIRLNPMTVDGPAHEWRLELQNQSGVPAWVTHPDDEIDLALASINLKPLKDAGTKFHWFMDDKNVLTREGMRDEGISEGDGVFVLGFPMGLVGGLRNSVIVRSGGIARIQDCICGRHHSFYIDAGVFPGNSGGPVLIRPEVASVGGTKSPGSSALIGVVKSYIPWRDIAVSAQTGTQRVIFEENSGLAEVIPVDYINETIDEYEKRFVECGLPPRPTDYDPKDVGAT